MGGFRRGASCSLQESAEGLTRPCSERLGPIPCCGGGRSFLCFPTAFANRIDPPAHRFPRFCRNRDAASNWAPACRPVGPTDRERGDRQPDR